MDASAAGSGDLDVEVSSNGHLVRIKRQPLGQSQYRYTYIPKQGGEHLIDVLYNSERVPGMYIISVYILIIMEESFSSGIESFFLN